jgi:heptosyltransferase-3
MPIDLPDAPRILVVTLRRIGDVLLTTPLIRSLRRAWPRAKIDVLAFAGTTSIVERNPDIDGVIAMPARPNTIESLGVAARVWRRYDLAISTQPGDRPTFFTLVAGRTHLGLTLSYSRGLVAFYKRRALHRSIEEDHSISRVEQMLRLADALGVPRVPEVVCPIAEPVPAAPAGDYAVIHAAPMFSYTQWTRAGWRALAGRLAERGLVVVATSGPDKAERAMLDELWQGQATIYQLPWPQLVSLLARARVYIGPDTSVTHVAAAVGCPTVAVFGPTDPTLWGPWPASGPDRPWEASGAVQNRGNVWLVQNPLPCMPCHLEGCERHIGSRSACLDQLTPEQVLSAVDQALDLHPNTAIGQASA